jgi:hypothetical protein
MRVNSLLKPILSYRFAGEGYTEVQYVFAITVEGGLKK